MEFHFSRYLKMNGLATEWDYDYSSYSYGDGDETEGRDSRRLTGEGSGSGSGSGSQVIFPADNICDNCWINVLVVPTTDSRYGILASIKDVPITLTGIYIHTYIHTYTYHITLS